MISLVAWLPRRGRSRVLGPCSDWRLDETPRSRIKPRAGHLRGRKLYTTSILQVTSPSSDLTLGERTRVEALLRERSVTKGRRAPGPHPALSHAMNRLRWLLVALAAQGSAFRASPEG